MKIKKNKLSLYSVAVFGLALLAACGEENTTEVTEKTGMSVVAKGETMPVCDNENAGELSYVVDSAAVFYCTAGKWVKSNGNAGNEGASNVDGMYCFSSQDEKTKDYTISCKTDGGKVVTYTINAGKKGGDGKSAYELAKAAGYNGSEEQWLASLKGESGKYCRAEINEDETETTIYCQDDKGDEVSYVVKNGGKGNSCTVMAGEDGKSSTIKCEGSENVAVVKDGAVGSTCTIEDYNDNGKTGYKLTCPDNVNGFIWDGTDGKDGTGCSTADNGEGAVEVTCGEGDAKATVTLYKAMCGMVRYDPENLVCINGELIGRYCAGVAYNHKTSKCIDERRIVTLTFGSVEGYKTVTIDINDVVDEKKYSKTWMAENMNKVVNDGTQSWCYDGEAKNCETYGRLYTWAAAVGKTEKECGYGKFCSDVWSDVQYGRTVQGVCFDGWHLPSQGEWNDLFDAVGGAKVAGTRLKSTSGWNSYTDKQNEAHSGNGTDLFGFTVLPAGYSVVSTYESMDKITYESMGEAAFFWTSTMNDYIDTYCQEHAYGNCSDTEAYGWYVRNNYSEVENEYSHFKYEGFSVRCVKND